MNQIISHNSINVLPPSMKKRVLPHTVVKCLTGARVIGNYNQRADTVAVEWCNNTETLHVSDFAIVKKVGDSLWREIIEGRNLLPMLYATPTILMLLQLASERVEKIVDEQLAGGKKKKVLFVKDKSGCGYWRMTVPARYIDNSKYQIDLSEVEVPYEFLLEYDTIVVQRLHEWAQYHITDKLRRMGRKLVYDIDDDMFNIPAHNPVAKVVGVDQLHAARAIMGIMDVIVTPSEVIKERFGFADKTMVIPNAIDLDDGWYQMTGDDAKDIAAMTSPDGYQRILWQGSATHEIDWSVCFDAVNRVMMERPNVRLVLLGFIPSCIRKALESDMAWQGRVEFSKFSEVETYVAIMKKLRADVAIAPLVDDTFNKAKSPIKFVEYSASIMPCVTSNVTPYKEVIKHNENGMMASTTEEWYNCITKLLDSPQERLRLVRNARKTVDCDFDIKKIAAKWEQIL